MTPAAAAGIASLVLLGACTGVADRPVAVELDRPYRPTVDCTAEIKTPQIVTTMPASLPPEVWDRKAGWQSRMRFRIDASGTPYDIRAAASGYDSPLDAIERASTAALAGYRFCAPVGFSTQAEWSATLHFAYARIAAASGGGEMFVQSFVPVYQRADVSQRRTGKSLAVGTFQQDGRPSLVRVSSSSGDAVLDRKSLESMATYQLVFRPGTTLTRPLSFEQPFTFEIR